MNETTAPPPETSRSTAAPDRRDHDALIGLFELLATQKSRRQKPDATG